MTRPQGSNEQDTDKQDAILSLSASPIFNIIKAGNRAGNAVAKLAFKEHERIERRIEHLTEARKQTERDLLLGTIDREQADKKREQIRGQLDEADEMRWDLVQFVTQLNRDDESNRGKAIERIQEQYKLEYDFNKHITTLGTGSILFIAALVRLAFPKVAETQALSLLFVALSLLALSVMSAALAMKGNIYATSLGESARAVRIVDEASWLLFTCGILTFLYYVYLNLSNATVENERTLLIGYLVVLVLACSVGAFLGSKIWALSRNEESTERSQEG